MAEIVSYDPKALVDAFRVLEKKMQTPPKKNKKKQKKKQQNFD